MYLFHKRIYKRTCLNQTVNLGCLTHAGRLASELCVFLIGRWSEVVPLRVYVHNAPAGI